MEKQITIQANAAAGRDAAEVMKKVGGAVAGAVEMLRRYYSDVLDREVSMAQMRLLIEAQAAFTACILPADFPLVVRVACGVWLLLALRRCKKAMRRE